MGSGFGRQAEDRLAAVYGTFVDPGHWFPVIARKAGRVRRAPQSSRRRSRSAFEITETDDRLIAAAAIIGESSKPTNG